MNLDDLIDNTAKGFETAISDLLDQASDDQKAVIRRASRRIVELQFQIMGGDPDVREQAERDMMHNLSTLQTEGNIAGVRAAQRLGEVFTKALDLTLDIAVGLA